MIRLVRDKRACLIVLSIAVWALPCGSFAQQSPTSPFGQGRTPRTSGQRQPTGNQGFGSRQQGGLGSRQRGGFGTRDTSGGRTSGRQGLGRSGGSSFGQQNQQGFIGPSGGVGGGIRGQGGLGAGGLRGPGGAIVSGGIRTDVSVIGGFGSGVRVVGEEAFEPAKSHKLVYGPVPELDDESTLTFIGESMTTVEFLEQLSMATNWNILATPATEELTLRGWVNDMTPKQALNMLQFYEIYYEYDEENDFFYVMTKDEYLEREFGAMEERGFFIENARLEDAELVVSSLLSGNGRLVVTPSTSQLIVHDTADNLSAIDNAIRALDVPLESRTFTPKFIEAEALVNAAESILSEVGEMRIDTRTNTLIVIDHPTHQERFAELVEAVDLPLETRRWTLDYADPADMAEQMMVYIPEGMGHIAINDSIHQVIVSATPERLDLIDQLVEAWDVRRKQVQIEAFLVTATRNVVRNFGINWALFGESGNDPLALQFGDATPRFNEVAGSGQRISVGQLPSVRNLVSPVTGEAITDVLGNPLVRSFRGNELSAVLDYLETEGDVTILAHPRITVQDGEIALFENSTQVPFSQSTTRFGNSNAGGGNNFNSVSSIDFIDVGTILEVQPRISEKGSVLLQISSEDSSFELARFQSNGLDNEVPQKTQNRAQTLVMVHDRETIVVGGLRTSNFADDIDKVPFLGDIPFLGRLFRSSRRDHKHRELLIFITPTIVDEYTQAEAERLAQYDDGLAASMRRDEKNAFRRGFRERKEGRRRELVVSIGRSGTLFHEGRTVTLEKLQESFLAREGSKRTAVVIRQHPAAPPAVSEGVAELALQAGLKVSFDDSSPALVPTVRPVPTQR